ncbi:MAG: aryl-alcohol dehydrogenase [candidate division Zixibacteria bacterium]|nr:aryl-alcohol dehydrogenase [candidate division Zixibacteria bacterium]
MVKGNEQISRLGLGTVQFGLDYGISNQQGQNSIKEAGQILSEAKTLGVEILDTSPNYGTSEEVLGKCLVENSHFNIVTKTPIFDEETITEQSGILLTEYFEKSLERLGCDKLYGLLVHHAENLLTLGGKYLIKSLNELKSKGLVNKIGVSVYNGEQIDKILDVIEPDIVQLPINLFDQRLIDSGHLVKLKKLGTEIHARSVFLQGLLLMQSENIPDYFEPIKNDIDNYFLYLKEQDVSPQEAALNFAKNIEEIDYIILGVNSVNQLKENVNAFNKKVNINFKRFAIVDEKFINPTSWKI